MTVPESVTRARSKIALVRAGLYTTVNDYVAQSGDLELQIWWNEPREFERNNPLIAGVAAVLQLTSEQVDALFIAAQAV